jgi:triacylglycerol esterase/lipase EstA (alpha/beta hydrolase family)
MKILSFATISVCGYLLIGCAQVPVSHVKQDLNNVQYLPASNIAVKIASLSSCIDPKDTTLNLNKHEPVTIIVHGCFHSEGRFRSLADVFAFHGQQAVCFNYDDRDSLAVSSADLMTAVEALATQLDHPKISIIGHSQGGLVARHAFIKERPVPFQEKNTVVDLTTISTPFGGIKAAAHCGSSTLAWLSLGLTKPICQIITGSKYKEIPPNASFITNPGQLQSAISRHLKIMTDEVGTCRSYDDKGTCVSNDFVFSVEEQVQKKVDSDVRQVSVLVKAGHVEIVGDAVTAPKKLIGILQQHGVLRTTPPHLVKQLSDLLETLYENPASSVSQTPNVN